MKPFEFLNNVWLNFKSNYISSNKLDCRRLVTSVFCDKHPHFVDLWWQQKPTKTCLEGQIWQKIRA
jgi:hypothetical protein